MRFHPITELTRNIASNCEEKSSFAETQSHQHDIIIDFLTATLATNPWACGPTEKECGGKKIFGNKQGADKKLRRAVMKTPVTNGAAPLLQTIRTAHNIAQWIATHSFQDSLQSCKALRTIELGSMVRGKFGRYILVMWAWDSLVSTAITL